jgi:hypothetical protein
MIPILMKFIARIFETGLPGRCSIAFPNRFEILSCQLFRLHGRYFSFISIGKAPRQRGGIVSPGRKIAEGLLRCTSATSEINMENFWNIFCGLPHRGLEEAHYDIRDKHENLEKFFRWAVQGSMTKQPRKQMRVRSPPATS